MRLFHQLPAVKLLAFAALLLLLVAATAEAKRVHRPNKLLTEIIDRAPANTPPSGPFFRLSPRNPKFHHSTSENHKKNEARWTAPDSISTCACASLATLTSTVS